MAITKTKAKNSLKRSSYPKNVGQDLDFPVVGIGASAGGLEAISSLLENIPAKANMTIVVIQHLDPHHSSLLPELISRRVLMPVIEATNDMVLQPNHIYIIPPNKTLTISYGKFDLESRIDSEKPHMAINAFLQSLAHEKRHRAIGIILSGTGNDGTEGLRAIKAEGGLTFAQTPQTAQYTAMPENAIKQGVVDFVFSPKEIARELVRVVKYSPVIFNNVEKQGYNFLDKENTQKNLFSLLRIATGIDFSGYKPATVNRRVARRMILKKIESLPKYVDYLREHSEEVLALYDDLLILVTSFFRDPEVFRSIYLTALPHVFKNKGKEALRVWVPGCSTGEEVYSLCMMISEYLEQEKIDISVQVFATDVSKSAIEFARRGVYSDQAVINIEPKRLQRFFIRTDDGWKVSKKIRGMCIFSKHDVTSEAPYSTIDILCCRNLLIYLTPRVQEKVLQVFHYSLCQDGILILGISETTGASSDFFEPLDKKYRIYRRRNAKSSLLGKFQTIFSADRLTPQPDMVLAKDRIDITKEVEKILLKKHVFPTILVDSRLKILEFYGEIGAYLDPTAGTANLTLGNMVNKGLVLELQVLLSEAKSKRKSIRNKETMVQFDGEVKTLYLEVAPLHINYNTEGPEYFLIVIRDLERSSDTVETQSITEKSETAELIEYLKSELAASKENLLAVIEEREGTNEELQSYNEELQSINEEMETAREELQSTNEELTTLNDELHDKNEELNIANSDLVNFFSSVNLPFVLLDRSLRIRKFTLFAKKTLNLIEGDIGRPFSDSRFSTENGLLTLIQESLETLTQKEMEILGMDGHWYLLKVRPYKDFNDHIDGVILAFIDISELKQAILEEKSSRIYIEAIFDTIREPLVILNKKFCIQKANDAFYQLFKTTEAKIATSSIFEIDNGQLNLPELRKLLKDILPNKSKFEDFKVEATISGIGKITLSLNARQLLLNDGKDSLIMLAIQVANESRKKLDAAISNR